MGVNIVISEKLQIIKKCKFCHSDIDPKATRCPKCQGDLRNFANRHPILTFLGIIFIVLFWVVTILSLSTSQNKNSKQNSTNIPTSEAISEQYKTTLAESFCQNRSDGEPYFDLQPIAKYFDDQKDADKLIYNTTKKPLTENCKKVAEGCLKIWSKQECEDVANKKIWIGMNEMQLNLSWGNPNDKNNTTGSWGTHSQWVYGSPIYGANYVYLEGKTLDDMKVTSWQD